jgi:hypothetical protein
MGEGGMGPGGGSFGGSSGGTTVGSGGTAVGSGGKGSGGNGSGGTTEVSGGAAGGGGDYSGGAGGGGAGGSGGDPNAVAQACAEACQVDGDCFKVAGVSNNRICDPTTHRCVIDGCDSDSECVPAANPWVQSCDGDDACSNLQTCIEVNGAGRCADIPDNGACKADMESISWKHFGNAANVTICADTSLKCRAKICVKPCTSTSCANPGTACNPVTGLCDLCTSDAACGGIVKPPHCNVNTGVCECFTDSDCATVVNTNVCVNGRCGCTGDSVCTRKTGNNSTLVCE